MNSVPALMKGLIDYAGMFPPARLPLPVALANFLQYCDTSAGRHVLKCFLCPTRELAALVSHASTPHYLPVSAIGGGGDDIDAFLRAFTADLGAIHLTNQPPQNSVVVKAVELKLPSSLCTLAQFSTFENLLGDMNERAKGMLDRAINPYLEISFAADWTAAVPRCIAAVAAFNRQHPDGRGFARYGVKIRTGGIEAGQFPSTDQVALWIESCARESVPFKATAGLHHPIRQWSSETGCKMHGFVNVFFAATLAHASARLPAVDRAILLEVLNEENPSAFGVTADAIQWKGISLTTEQIDAARRELAHSYGSCSFTEPVEELNALGWFMDPST